MASPRFPDASLAWLVPTCRRPVLDLGGGLTDQIATTNRVVAACHGDDVPQSSPAVRTKPSLLPFAPGSFDLVTATDGELLVSPVLSEAARVLAPGGQLAAIEYSRDDSIPWVRRFAERLQADDPTAMRAHGSRLLEFIEGSHHFVDAQHRIFRRWVPLSRDRLLGMVLTRPAVIALDEKQRSDLTADLLAIHDRAARPGEKLQLPFEVVCVRAEVDPSTVEAPAPRTDALSIRLHF